MFWFEIKREELIEKSVFLKIYGNGVWIFFFFKYYIVCEVGKFKSTTFSRKWRLEMHQHIELCSCWLLESINVKNINIEF